MNALTIILILAILILAFLLCVKKALDSAVEIKKGGNILKSLSISEKLSLSESDGEAIIFKAKNVFKHYIDPGFQNWDLRRKSKTTLETEVEVYEMVKDATFKDIFISLLDNIDSLCLTQSQIIDFCEKHRSHLRQDVYATFFLTKKDFGKPATEDNLFVVSVRVFSDGLDVLVFHFDDARVWRAGFRPRVVVPKLS